MYDFIRLFSFVILQAKHIHLACFEEHGIILIVLVVNHNPTQTVWEENACNA